MAPDAGKLLDLFARFTRLEPEGGTDQSRYIVWSLLHQDEESGATPSAAQNPFTGRLTAEEVEIAERAVASCLTLKDGHLWARLGEVLAAERPLDRRHQIGLVELCRLSRSRTRFERRAIKAYSRAWPTRSQDHLRESLRRLPESEICAYMATYKPKGLVPAPPFGLGAEFVIATLGGALGPPTDPAELAAALTAPR